MVPPVSRDGFFQSGDSFYVEIHPGRHRHPRCDSTSLYGLLNWTDPKPLLTKAGKIAKRQPEPHKDNPRHFYEAQCVHYGLKQYKTREVAKKHLLAAYDPVTKMLEVPPRILEIEKALKEEYKIANEAEKKKYQEKKRRNEEWIAQQLKKEVEEGDAMLKEFKAAGITISKGQVSKLKRSGHSHADKTISDAQLRIDIASLPEPQLRAMITTLVFDALGAFLFKKAVIKEVIALKEQVAKANGNRLELLSDRGGVNGEYTIMAPYLRQEWSSNTDRMSLKISVSPGQSHLWASFDFGIHSGIMRSQGRPPKYVGDTVELHWKGQASGSGETSFDERNLVSITFFGEGRIRGKMRAPAAGTFEFIGKKGPKSNIMWVKHVDSWKSEYRDINERSYEAANRARWGGWYDPGDWRQRTPNSDTDSNEADLYGSDEDESEDKSSDEEKDESKDDSDDENEGESDDGDDGESDDEA